MPRVKFVGVSTAPRPRFEACDEGGRIRPVYWIDDVFLLVQGLSSTLSSIWWTGTRGLVRGSLLEEDDLYHDLQTGGSASGL